MRRQLPEGLTLVHDGERWSLTFGRYVASVRACSCDLPPCTCRRRRAADQWYGTHHQRYCHRGHAEHIALLFRRAALGSR